MSESTTTSALTQLFVLPHGGTGPVVSDHYVKDAYPFLGRVHGVEFYGDRGLALSLNRPDEIVGLLEDAETRMAVLGPYLESLGLTLPRIVYQARPREVLTRFHNHTSFFFKLIPEITKLRPEHMGKLAIVDWLENKNQWVRACEQAGIRVPVTQYFDGSDDECPVWRNDSWLKEAVGASGNSVRRCKTRHQFEQALSQVSAPFQLQEHIPGDICSAQLWVEAAGVQVLTTSDQIMGGADQAEHVGNRFPSQHHDILLPEAEKAGELARQLGYTGYCGDDYVVSTADGQPYELEKNARVTGAHYPYAVGGHLGWRQFMHQNLDDLQPALRNPEAFFERLERQGLLYTTSRTSGVLPWHIGPILVGKVMVLCPGTPTEQDELYAELVRLCVA